MAAAARLAALRERIKGKQSAEDKRVAERVAVVVHRSKEEEEKQKAEQRAVAIQRLKEKAAKQAEDQNAQTRVAAVREEEPVAKKPRLVASPQQCPPELWPKCKCGHKVVQRAVQREGRHRGRLFFLCPEVQCKFFEWADENGQPPRVGLQQDVDSSTGAEAPRLCTGCGQQASQRVSKKEGPNCGRVFFCCPQRQEERTAPACSSFFVWGPAEGAVQPANAGEGGVVVTCGCGNPAIPRTVQKEGPNKGRVFYTCAQPKESQCAFFFWADKVEASQNAIASSPDAPKAVADDGTSAPLCLCGQSAKKLTVNKNGPTFGRVFWKCQQTPQCKYFMWDDARVESDASGGIKTPTATPQAKFGATVGGAYTPNVKSPPKGSDGNPAKTCFRCGGFGHWARNCPNAK